jgi:hypothetical protein
MSHDYTDLIARLSSACLDYEMGSSLSYMIDEAADAIAALVAENAQLLQSEADLTGRFTEIAPCDPGDMPSLIAARALAAHRAVVAERDAARTVALEAIDWIEHTGVCQADKITALSLREALAARQPTAQESK